MAWTTSTSETFNESPTKGSGGRPRRAQPGDLTAGDVTLIGAGSGGHFCLYRAAVRDPVDVLAEGSAILAPVLTPLGYSLAETAQGKGSGGAFATGRWLCGERSIEIHVRQALGIVDYRWGDLTLSHQQYLRVQDVGGSYPGFRDNPIDGFRHLAEDLAGPVHPMLVCDHAEFAALVEAAHALPDHFLP